MENEKRYIQLSNDDVDAYKAMQEVARRYATLNEAMDGVWDAFGYLAEVARNEYGVEVNAALFEEVFAQVEGELWAEVDERENA